ncbi:hypothetical protein JMJ35_004161 [Cladonia borealis]|uniref:Uncharacterized protein n=1 Tax=Cladonia borealis TaxID=184061 RepID=A0AA39R1P5_9LECA|nr:hypothetical protein JMJ35_004161 [Cladonia borealis]
MRVKSLFLVFTLSSYSLISHAFPLIPQAPARQPALRRRVAYSVVAVDGGSAAASSSANAPVVTTIIQTSDQTETVTAPPITLPPSTETITSTAILTTLEPAKTVDVSVTQSPGPVAYQVVNADESSPSPSTSYITETFTASSSVNSKSSTSTKTSTLTSTSTSISTLSTTPAISSATIPGAEPAIITTAPAQAGWVAPAGLLPPSSTITTYSTHSTTTSKTYDDGMWHTTWRVWNATSTTPTTSIATAVITSGSYDDWK